MGGEEVWLLLILNLGTRWGWVVSITPRPRFTPGEMTPGTHCTGGWVSPRAGLDAEVRRKILCLCRGLNPGRSVRSQSLYWLSYLGSYPLCTPLYYTSPRHRIFPLAPASRPALGPTQPSLQWVPGVLSPGVKCGRGVLLTTHPHLVPRLRMSRSCTSSPPMRFHGV
jgi:hypothetical protein